MVTTEPAIPAHGYSAWVSKLYPSNIQRMLNKDLIRFTSTPKSSTWKKYSVGKMDFTEIN